MGSDGVDCTFPMAWIVLFQWRGLYFPDGVIQKILTIHVVVGPYKEIKESVKVRD